MKGPNPAKRPNDARLRPGGRKEKPNARMSPATISRAKELATARGESLGEYLERLVLDDAALRSPPVTGR